MRAFAAILFAFTPLAMTQSLTGLWHATVLVNGVEVPFRMEFSTDGANPHGSFFNGDEKVTSTNGVIDGSHVTLIFAHYGTRLDATLKNGVLEGEYGRTGRSYTFRAHAATPVGPVEGPVPSISGDWEIQVHSPKGESAWRFSVRQHGPEVAAVILRVDGDTGTLTGRFNDGRFVLSHFSGARPLLLEVTPQQDGSLSVVQNAKNRYIAYRPDVARQKGLTPPSDPSNFTHVANADEALRFSFPNLNGRVVSNTDARFQGKVVIVSIMGSWCPNCHDEAPFLVELYRKYHAQGLEIVALSFEDADQLKDPERLRAFIAQYGIEYPVLLGGEPGEVREKLPQAVNLNCWPTTFIMGRDGLVRAVHAGFPGKASGPLHEEAVREMNEIVAGLLNEPLRSAR